MQKSIIITIVGLLLVLTSCNSPSPVEQHSAVTVLEEETQPTVADEVVVETIEQTQERMDSFDIPLDCKSYFDGCNPCIVENGEIIKCIPMDVCEEYAEPGCMDSQSDGGTYQIGDGMTITPTISP